MSTRRSNIRKRERQKQRHAQRPQPQPKPTTKPSATSGIIAELARPISSRALREAIEELQRS
jgi:hypothetical protein